MLPESRNDGVGLQCAMYTHVLRHHAHASPPCAAPGRSKAAAESCLLPPHNERTAGCQALRGPLLNSATRDLCLSYSDSANAKLHLGGKSPASFMSGEVRHKQTSFGSVAFLWGVGIECKPSPEAVPQLFTHPLPS